MMFAASTIQFNNGHKNTLYSLTALLTHKHQVWNSENVYAIYTVLFEYHLFVTDIL